MTAESVILIHQLHNDYMLIRFALPVVLLSSLDLIATTIETKTGKPLIAITNFLVLAWMAWMNWEVALTATALFIVFGVVVNDLWVAKWVKFGAAPILLTTFSAMVLWLPHAWVLPLMLMLIGIPAVIALMVNSTGFRVGVMATLGVLTVLGVTNAAFHFLAFVR